MGFAAITLLDINSCPRIQVIYTTIQGRYNTYALHILVIELENEFTILKVNYLYKIDQTLFGKRNSKCINRIKQEREIKVRRDFLVS